MNPNKNFQQYRALLIDLLTFDNIETTIKEEFIFEHPIRRMEEGSMIKNTIILQTLKKFLEKQESSPTFHAHVCEPNTYHSDHRLDTATGWLRSVERYLEMVNLGEHRWTDYAATLLHGEADT